ncbi:MAG: CSLREA domain-containing protein [Deltaproteobacteria bacterium]|nr:CSLREA domain-containing protein [Deltaproteobacteria bacterium]
MNVKRQATLLLFSALLLTWLASAMTNVATVHAAIFVVTKTADTVDGACNADCSLREAIIAANTTAATDTIQLPAGLYTLSIPATGSDSAANGDLDITNDLTIQGQGASTTRIDGNQLDRVFHVFASATVSMSGVTIRNGLPSAAQGSIIGGGILNRGDLTLTNVTVSDNAADNGGGISNTGNLTLMASTLSLNAAVIGGGVTNTSEGSLTLVNSTVSGNTAQQDGGGIHNQADARIRNSTIAENSIQTPGASEEIANADGVIILSNTLVVKTAGSTGTACGGDGLLLSLGFNLDNDGSCGFTNPGDLSNTDPQLAPLQDNGGPTKTHALPSNSPAIDAGDPDGCLDAFGDLLTTDQRGAVRPIDGNQDDQIVCDIGAYEFALALDLELAKRHDAAFTVDAHGVYTLEVKNIGALATQGTTTVTDTLPTGQTFVSGTGAGWGCLASNQTVTCTHPGVIAAQGSSTITLEVMVALDSPGMVTNIATVATAEDANQANDQAEDIVTILQPDLQLEKTLASPFCDSDSTGIYTLQVTNNGSGPTIDITTIADVLPDQVGFVEADGAGWNCTVSVGLPQIVTCTHAAVIDANASTQVALSVAFGEILETGVENTATVATAGDNDETNNQAPVTCTPTPVLRPDLRLQKTRVDPFVNGQTGHYIFTITNDGKVSTNGTITLTDQLPAGFTYKSASGQHWNCDAGPPVTCTRTTPLAVAETTIVWLAVAIDTPFCAINMAAVSTPMDDNHANDTATNTVCPLLNSGAPAWLAPTQEPGDTTGLDTAHQVAFDNQGNVVAVGVITNTATGEDFAVVKIDKVDGHVLWRRQTNGAADGQDQALALAVDQETNDVFAAGYITDTSGARDMFVVKYDTDGNPQWSKRLSGTMLGGQDEGFALALLAGDVVVAGKTQNQSTSRDFTVIRLSGTTGEEVWSSRYLPTGLSRSDDVAFAVGIDHQGDVLAAGQRGDAQDGTNLTVVKIAGDSGQERWRKELQGSQPGGTNNAASLVFDLDEGNNGNSSIVVAGTLENAGSNADFSIIKFRNSDGTEMWRRALNGDAPGAYDAALTVALDPTTGEVVAGGTIQRAASGADFTVIKFAASDGAVVWWQGLSGDAPQGLDTATSVAVEASGHVVAAGTLQNNGTGQDFTLVELDQKDGHEHWRKTENGAADAQDMALTAVADPDPSRSKIAVGGWVRESTDATMFTVHLYQGTLPLPSPADPPSVSVIDAEKIVPPEEGIEEQEQRRYRLGKPPAALGESRE